MSWVDDPPCDECFDDTETIEGKIKAFTDKAILFETGNEEHWIPRSQIEEEYSDQALLDSKMFDEEIAVTIPAWLSVRISEE